MEEDFSAEEAEQVEELEVCLDKAEEPAWVERQEEDYSEGLVQLLELQEARVWVAQVREQAQEEVCSEEAGPQPQGQAEDCSEEVGQLQEAVCLALLEVSLEQEAVCLEVEPLLLPQEDYLATLHQHQEQEEDCLEVEQPLGRLVEDFLGRPHSQFQVDNPP